MQRKIFTVDGHAQIVGDIAILAGRLANRLFNRRKNDFTTDATFAFDVLHDRQQLVVHSHLFSAPFCQKSKQDQRIDPPEPPKVAQIIPKFPLIVQG
jgi:hypothetical protein